LSRCSLSQQKVASELVQWIVPVKSNKNSVHLENKVKKKRHNKPENADCWPDFDELL